MSPRRERVMEWIIGGFFVVLGIAILICVFSIVMTFFLSQSAVRHTGVVRAVQVEPGLLVDAVVVTFESGIIVRASCDHGDAIPGVGQCAEVLGSGMIRVARKQAPR